MEQRNCFGNINIRIKQTTSKLSVLFLFSCFSLSVLNAMAGTVQNEPQCHLRLPFCCHHRRRRMKFLMKDFRSLACSVGRYLCFVVERLACFIFGWLNILMVGNAFHLSSSSFPRDDAKFMSTLGIRSFRSGSTKLFSFLRAAKKDFPLTIAHCLGEQMT
jgi:hypothetical protein